MDLTKPKKTPADYLVIAVSPVLIMLLVGSLSFFLIQVFYRGEAIGSVRWVLFWFVMAAVLVSRIGIEQGNAHAAAYGLALAAATWLYLARIHPAYFLGTLLLGVVWWCANRLTRDCTLIDDSEDASGSGLLQNIGENRKGSKVPKPEPEDKKPASISRNQGKNKRRSTSPHPPGLWVVYFSLAALPLFGIGQMLLPTDDVSSHQMGFIFLFVYMTAALGLLLTTSFLGLRRYLRQRFLEMPGNIAFGWVKFGIGVAFVVLMATLLLPRPGVGDTWKSLRYHVDYQIHRASEYAARFNPHGKGRGQSDNEIKKTEQSGKSQNSEAHENKEKEQSGNNSQNGQNQTTQNQSPTQTHAGPVSNGLAGQLYKLFRDLLMLAVILLATWWLFRRRYLILQMIQSFIAELVQFFRNLFQFNLMLKKKIADKKEHAPKLRLFAAYKNPFFTGGAQSWPPERVILYSYEAVQAWARERGINPQPQQTAREFCRDLCEKFPEISSELNRLAFLHGHATYGTKLPENCNLEPVRQLWRYLSGVDVSTLAA
jgi:Domain of unknown function (DUF4129)